MHIANAWGLDYDSPAPGAHQGQQEVFHADCALRIAHLWSDLNATYPGYVSACRPLAPGTYTITASAPGYAPQTASVEVPATGKGVVHDFLLTASAEEVKPSSFVVPT